MARSQFNLKKLTFWVFCCIFICSDIKTSILLGPSRNVTKFMRFLGSAASENERDLNEHSTLTLIRNSDSERWLSKVVKWGRALSRAADSVCLAGKVGDVACRPQREDYSQIIIIYAYSFMLLTVRSYYVFINNWAFFFKSKLLR